MPGCCLPRSLDAVPAIDICLALKTSNSHLRGSPNCLPTAYNVLVLRFWCLHTCMYNGFRPIKEIGGIACSDWRMQRFCS